MVATKERASVRETGEGGAVELRLAFDRDLVDDLKETVAPRFRKWDVTERRWIVLGAYAPAAVELLLSHHPHAEIPPSYVRQSAAVVVKKAPPLPILEPLPDDQERLAPLVAVIPCPRCGERHERPVCVAAQASEAVAKHEIIAPELLSVCPSCRSLLVIAFHPAPSFPVAP